MDLAQLKRELEKKEALRSAVRSADGKELLREVDAAAAEQAVRSGDRAALANVFRKVIATPEGRALAEKIRKAMSDE